ncbi:MAG: sugar phosphate nucleotidyltransferase [Fidelibacterota bacterium]
MKAIIPAAGIGKRLRPHTYNTPKVLLNVAGKPIISHIIDDIIDRGIGEIVVIVGYQGEKLRDYLTNNYKKKFSFVEQTERKGLGHAVGLGLEKDDEPVLIILGDTIFDVDYKRILSLEKSAIGVTPVEDPRRFGIVELKDGRVINLVEKPDSPSSNLVISGLYFIKNQGLLKKCIDRLVSENIKTKGEYQLTDALRLMLEMGEPIEIFDVRGWYDCGSKDSILETNRILLERKTRYSPGGGSKIIRPVHIAATAVVVESIIGPYATIDEGAEIKGSIIRDSIIGKKAMIENCNIEHSIIGSHAAVRGKRKILNVGDYSEVEVE